MKAPRNVADIKPVILPGDLLSITCGTTVRVRAVEVEARDGLFAVNGTVEGGTFNGAAYRWDQRFGGTFFVISRGKVSK